MGDWSTQASCFAELENNYYWAEQNRATLFTDLPWIQSAIDAGNALLACQRIKYALSRVHNISRYLIDYEPAYNPSYPILYYLNYYAPVTWKSIVEAWVKDDYEGRKWTIAIIDHMRKIIWNEPYDIKFAARPTES